MNVSRNSLFSRIVGTLVVALALGRTSPSAQAQSCCGGPLDGKKIPVLLTVQVQGDGGQVSGGAGVYGANLNVTWVAPAPSNNSTSVFSGTMADVRVSQPYQMTVYVPFGATVTAIIGGERYQPVNVTATLSSPCPDSQTVTGTLPPPGQAQGAPANLTLSLKVKHPDQTAYAGQCVTKLNNVDVSFGLGKISGGQSAGEIWIEEPSITPTSATRQSLHFWRTDGQDGVSVKTDGTGLRQVCTGGILADLVDVANGFEVRFYSAGNFFTIAGVPLWLPSGNYFRKWVIDQPGTGQLRVSGCGAGNGAGINQALLSQTTYTQGDNGTMQLSESGNAGRTETRSVVFEQAGTDADFTGDPNRANETVEVRTTTLSGLGIRVEKLIGDQIRVVQVQDAEGSILEKTFYTYDRSGNLQTTQRQNSQGQVIGYQSTVQSMATDGTITTTTLSPFLDDRSARQSIQSPASSTEQIGSTQVAGSYASNWGTGQSVQLQDPATGAVVSAQLQSVFTSQIPGVSSTTTTITGVFSIPVWGWPWVGPPPVPMPVNSYLTGKVWQDMGADGLVRAYQYEMGSWSAQNQAFNTGTGGTALRETVFEGMSGDGLGVPWPRSNRSSKRVTVTDEAGNTVAEETWLYVNYGWSSGPVSRTLHSYDGEGHLVQSVKDGTTIYQAPWADGLKQSETDENGGVTTFGNFDAQGRPWHIVRHGAAGWGSVPAIPDLTTDVIYDALGRKTNETAADGQTTTTRSWTYDALGRVKSETLNGLTTSYDYAYAAKGGLIVTKTTLGGRTEITESYLDGRTKSISGSGVVPQTFSYGVNPDGTQWETVTTGAAGDPLTATTTTDWLGRTIAEQRPADGGPATSTQNYGSYGLLASETPAGLGTRSYSYDFWSGQAPGTYIPADLTTTTINTSSDGTHTDRTAQYYKVIGSEYFRVTQTSLGTTMEKVGGFSPWELGLTVSVDPAGYETRTYSYPGGGQCIIGAYGPYPSVSGAATYSYVNGSLGLAQVVVKPSSATVSYGYDGFGRQVKAIDSSTGTVTTTTYDPTFGNVATVTVTGTGQQLTTSNIYYAPTEAAPGQLKSRTVNGQTTYFAYDALGRQTQVWGPAAYPLWYEYDGNGRLQRLHTYRTGSDALWSGPSWPSQGGTGDVTTWTYVQGTTLVRSKTDAAQQGVSYNYYPSGLLQQRNWARGVATSYTYNEAGDLKTTSYTDGTPGIALSYDNNGRVQSMSDAGGSHWFGYGPLGQLEWDGVSSGILSGMSLWIGHGAAGRLQSVQVSNNGTALLGAGQSFTYDFAGRMSSVSDGKNTATYTYLPYSDWLQTIDIPGQITVTRTPDSLGRLQSIVTTVGNGGATVESHSWHYDANGRRGRDTLADQSYWAYSYNGRGEVIGGVKNLQGAVPVLGHAFGYGYDAIGNRQQTTVNGRAATYMPNQLNQYVSRTVPPAVDVLGSAAAGGVVQISTTNPMTSQTALRQGGLFAAAVPLDNSTAAQFPNVSISATVTTAAGASVTQTDSTTTGNLFLAQNPESFTYDADGNRTGDGRWHYTWDGENRLSAAETLDGAAAAGVPRTKIEYVYDGRGRRIQRKVSSGWNGTAYAQAVARRFLYDAGWNVLAEVDDAGAVVRRCLWGLDVSGSMSGAGGIGGLLVESIAATPGGALTDCFPFYDGNGNLTGLLDAAGTEVARYEYGPFGETLRQSGPLAAANPWRWSTKWTEEATGLKDYGYRWLGDGRWLNRDPMGENGGINLFALIDNNVINDSDVLGRDSLVFSGSPVLIPDPKHDNTWRNYINAAELKIQQLRYHMKKGEEIVWVVEKTGYEARGDKDKHDYVADIRASARKLNTANYPVRLILVSNKGEFASAFNNDQTTSVSRDQSQRPNSQLSEFYYFGHGASGRLMTTCYLDGQPAPRVNWNFWGKDIKEMLIKGAITKGCKCVSYACNSATEGESGEASFATQWQDYFGVTFYGVKGKTDYGPSGVTKNPFKSRGMPVPEAGAQWVPSDPNPPVTVPYMTPLGY